MRKSVSVTRWGFFLGSLLLVLSQVVHAQDNEIINICENPSICQQGEDFVLDLRDFRASKSANIVTDARFEPFVIRKGIDHTKLLITVDDSSIVLIKIHFRVNTWFMHDGQFTGDITLYDDGTHGDENAGDKTFTLGGLSTNFNINLSVLDLTFVYSDDHEETKQVNWGFAAIRSVDERLEIPAIAHVTVDGFDFFYTEYVVNMITKFEPGPLDSLVGYFNAYFSLVPAPRDIVVFFWPSEPVFNPDRTASPGWFGSLGNTIMGIGQSVHDNLSYRGYNQTVDGMIHMYTHSSFSVLNHEMLHRWAVNGRDFRDLDLGSGHWGVIERSTTGFGGFRAHNGVYSQIVQESDSLYRGYKDYPPQWIFNDLEFYLAGLIGSGDVESPIKTLVNPEFLQIVRNGTESYDLYKADGFREVTMQEFIDTMGVRVPDYLNSPKEIKLDAIVLYDRPLTSLEMAYVHEIMRDYERISSTSIITTSITFYEATEGRASVKTRIFDVVVSNEPSHKPNEPPNQFVLYSNYPNPFNPSTTISYTLSQPGRVRLVVVDLLGREVAVLVDEMRSAGQHVVSFNAAHLPSGLYVYRLETEQGVVARKMILAK